MVRGLSLILIGVLSLAAGCSGSDAPPNLVLITVDTLRPDRLGYAGHDRPTSPNVDALAARGVVFTNAYSQSGWTLPSVATILTGHHPKDHGATDFHWTLDVTLPSLASTLRRNGYDTSAYVSHVMLTPSYGIADGFANYDYSVLDVGDPHDVATAQALTDLAVRGKRRSSEPYFLWIHYFDPHFAYLSHPATEQWGNREIDRYDGEIAHMDRHLARLMRAIDLENTVVVFTADHGEEFGEHGGQYHYTLHPEVMRVPLVIVAPGLEPRTVSRAVDQVDLMPTILSLLGLEGDNLPGRDVLAPDVSDQPLFVERDRPPPWRQQGVIHEGMSLFVVSAVDSSSIPKASRGTEVPVQNVIPGIFMYDLETDPGQQVSIYAEDDARALELLGIMAQHFATRRQQRDAVELDPDLVRKLKSLGYLR